MYKYLKCNWRRRNWSWMEWTPRYIIHRRFSALSRGSYSCFGTFEKRRQKIRTQCKQRAWSVGRKSTPNQKIRRGWFEKGTRNHFFYEWNYRYLWRASSKVICIKITVVSQKFGTSIRMLRIFYFLGAFLRQNHAKTRKITWNQESEQLKMLL